jgi:hypothetical protein
MFVVSVFFFVFMDLVFHFVKAFIKGRTCVFAFNVSHDGVEAIDFHQHFHINSRAFEFQSDVDFADGVQVPNQFLRLLSDVLSQLRSDTAVSTGDSNLHSRFPSIQ